MQTEFASNWKLFTQGVFEGMDWSNVCVAGGAVLSCLMPHCTVAAPAANSDQKQQSATAPAAAAAATAAASTVLGAASGQPPLIAGANGAHASDLDLFVYGLNPEQATKKLTQLLAFFAQRMRAAPAPAVASSAAGAAASGGAAPMQVDDGASSSASSGADILVSPYSVTLLGLYPFRHVQIVLRCYVSPAQVLMGFDIDCCCVAFDGRTVRACSIYVSRMYLLVWIITHDRMRMCSGDCAAACSACVAVSSECGGSEPSLGHVRAAAVQICSAWLCDWSGQSRFENGEPFLLVLYLLVLC